MTKKVLETKNTNYPAVHNLVIIATNKPVMCYGFGVILVVMPE